MSSFPHTSTIVWIFIITCHFTRRFFPPLHRRSSRIAVKCYWLVLNSAVERIKGLQHVEDFSLPRCDALPPDLRQQGILEVPVFDILIKDGGSDICNLVLISPFDISSKPYRHCFNLIVFPYPYCPQMTFSVSTIASLPPSLPCFSLALPSLCLCL